MRRLKVILVKPWSVADEIIPPISLGWLATSVRHSHDVTILDALKDRIDAEAVAKMVSDGAYDVAGFQAWSKDIHEIKRTLLEIKKIRPLTITIVGGIHPTMAPEGTLKFAGPVLDYAYKGEGEHGFLQLLDAVASESLSPEKLAAIPGLVWRNGEGMRVNPNCFIEELDSVGLPAWDLMPPDTYPKAPHGAFFRNFPMAPIVVTRGCPFPCTFCGGSAASGKKIRSRSVDSVIDELKLLHDRFGVKEFQIEDDNFTFNTAFVKDFCERLLSLNLGFTWSFPNGIRLDTIDPPLLDLMKKAGCYAINFGIESGSERILKLIRKNITPDGIRKQLRMARDAGFDIGGFFIVGFPSETEEEIMETIRFARSLPLDRVGISYFQPFPGTPIYYELVKSGEIAEEWAEHHHTSLHDLTYVTPTLTEEKLRSLRRKFLRSFYLRPAIFINMLRQVRSPQHFYFMAKRAVRWISA